MKHKRQYSAAVNLRPEYLCGAVAARAAPDRGMCLADTPPAVMRAAPFLGTLLAPRRAGRRHLLLAWGYQSDSGRTQPGGGSVWRGN